MSDDPAPGIPLDPNDPPPPPPKKKGQRNEDSQESGISNKSEEQPSTSEAPTSEANE